MGIIGASQIFLTNTQWADSFYRGYFAFWSVACTHVQHMAFPHGSRIIKEVGLWLEGRWMVFWPGDINKYVTAWLCSMLLLYVCIICMKQQTLLYSFSSLFWFYSRQFTVLVQSSPVSLRWFPASANYLPCTRQWNTSYIDQPSKTAIFMGMEANPAADPALNPAPANLHSMLSQLLSTHSPTVIIIWDFKPALHGLSSTWKGNIISNILSEINFPL